MLPLIFETLFGENFRRKSGCYEKKYFVKKTYILIGYEKLGGGGGGVIFIEK